MLEREKTITYKDDWRLFLRNSYEVVFEKQLRETAMELMEKHQ